MTARHRRSGLLLTTVVFLLAVPPVGIASCGSATLKTSDGAAGSGGGAAGNGGAAGTGALGGVGGAGAAAGEAGTKMPRDAAADSASPRDGSGEKADGCPATCPAPTSGPTTGTGVCVNDACSLACASKYPSLCSSSSSCVDTTSDGKNCGACGHDCLGGACLAGQCQPVELAQYTGNLQTIAVGAQYVYATTDLGYIGRANKDGSDLQPFAMPGFVSSTLPGTLVAEDGDRAFFVWYGNSPQLVYCSTTGCDASITPMKYGSARRANSAKR